MLREIVVFLTFILDPSFASPQRHVATSEGFPLKKLFPHVGKTPILRTNVLRGDTKNNKNYSYNLKARYGNLYFPSFSNSTSSFGRKKKFDLGHCPYCNPKFKAVPGMGAAMQGYDIPMGNPFPGPGKSDPGDRMRIFRPMKRSFGLREPNEFISAHSFVSCDSKWDERIYDTFEGYVNGKMDMFSIGKSIEVGKDISLAFFGGPKKKMMVFNFDFPTLFSRSESSNYDIAKMKSFFNESAGTIAVTQAICTADIVNISPYGKPVFTHRFIEAIKRLERVANLTKKDQENEFISFVQDFGTHFSDITHLGIRLYFETRYLAEERKNLSDTELEKCNTLNGIKVVGINLNKEKGYCSSFGFGNNETQTGDIDRFLISTYGKITFSSLSEWNREVGKLYSAGKLKSVPVKRNFVPILNLLSQKNFDDESPENSVNISAILSWFAPAMSNYCRIFKMDCSLPGCTKKCHSDYFLYPNSNLQYVGDTDNGVRNGKGTFFYKSQSRVFFNGNFSHGRIEAGTFYDLDGNIVSRKKARNIFLRDLNA